MELGGQAMRDQAAKFGFGQQLGIPMSVTPSSLPAQMNRAQEAQSAIGQYDVRVTPLQVAMVSAAALADGLAMVGADVESVAVGDTVFFRRYR